jgi:hypothetical protein
MLQKTQFNSGQVKIIFLFETLHNSNNLLPWITIQRMKQVPPKIYLLVNFEQPKTIHLQNPNFKTKTEVHDGT